MVHCVEVNIDVARRFSVDALFSSKKLTTFSLVVTLKTQPKITKLTVPTLEILFEQQKYALR